MVAQYKAKKQLNNLIKNDKPIQQCLVRTQVKTTINLISFHLLFYQQNITKKKNLVEKSQVMKFTYCTSNLRKAKSLLHLQINYEMCSPRENRLSEVFKIYFKPRGKYFQMPIDYYKKKRKSRRYITSKCKKIGFCGKRHLSHCD